MLYTYTTTQGIQAKVTKQISLYQGLHTYPSLGWPCGRWYIFLPEKSDYMKTFPPLQDFSQASSVILTLIEIYTL